MADIKKIQLIYFSPTGGTKRLATKLASLLSESLGVPIEETKLMQPEARDREYHFKADELVVLAVPTYAGRVPNKIAPDLRRILKCSGSFAVALAAYGNRSCGTVLEELTDILKESGARVIGAGAFVTRHAFNDKIGRGRPDREDRAELGFFANEVAEKLRTEDPSEVVLGPAGEYYTPLREDGEPARFLKAKPFTVLDKCYHCGLCVKSCVMGAIEGDCVTVSGVCIKCQACVRSCPTAAKYFDDEDFLSHVRMLEKHCVERAKNITKMH